MDIPDTLAELTRLLRDHLGVDATRPIALTDTLESALGLDSLGAVELIMAAEEHWQIEITDDEVEAWKTVQDMVTGIDAKLATRTQAAP